MVSDGDWWWVEMVVNGEIKDADIYGRVRLPRKGGAFQDNLVGRNVTLVAGQWTNHGETGVRKY